MKKPTLLISGIVSALLLSSCSNKENTKTTDADHNDTIKETFSIANLVNEVKNVPDSIIQYLHAQHHSHKVLERRTVPAGFETSKMKYWKNYVRNKKVFAWCKLSCCRSTRIIFKDCINRNTQSGCNVNQFIPYLHNINSCDSIEGT